MCVRKCSAGVPGAEGPGPYRLHTGQFCRRGIVESSLPIFFKNLAPPPACLIDRSSHHAIAPHEPRGSTVGAPAAASLEPPVLAMRGLKATVSGDVNAAENPMSLSMMSESPSTDDALDAPRA